MRGAGPTPRPACDMGCGPGHVARYLSEQGLEMVGVDLSPAMVERARRLTPQVEFRQGDMLALDVPDESWAGIAAFYSIIHIPRSDLPQALGELPPRVASRRPACCWRFTSAATRSIWTSGGVTRSLSTSFSSSPKKWPRLCARPASRSKKSSSAIRTLMWSIRAGGATSSLGKRIENWPAKAQRSVLPFDTLRKTCRSGRCLLPHPSSPHIAFGSIVSAHTPW